MIREFIARIRARRKARSATPRINTPWGPVSESARKQAVANMIADPALRLRVLAVVVKECDGDEGRGRTEFARRYPEVPL